MNEEEKINQMVLDVIREIKIKELQLKKLKNSSYLTPTDKVNVYNLEKELFRLKIDLNTLKDKRKELISRPREIKTRKVA